VKILIITTSFPGDKEVEIGGKFVYNEGLAYSQNGADVTVLTPHYKGSLKHKQINENYRVVRFPYFWPHKYQSLVNNQVPIYGNTSLLKLINFPFFVFSFLFYVLKYAKHSNIIHCNWTPTVLFALPARIFFKIPISLTARGSDIRLLPNWLNRWIFGKVNAAIDCYGPQPWNLELKRNFPSNYVKLPLISENIDQRNIPEDLPDTQHFHKSDFKILFLGRIDSVKLDTFQLPLFELIQATKILLEKNIKVFVCCIGGGDSKLMSKLNNLVRENKLTEHIKLLGFRKDPARYFRFFNVGIGGIAFNTVSQEFAMNHTLQIHVNSKENKDTPWENEKNCYFVEPGSAQKLSETLMTVYSQKTKNQEITNNAYNMMSQYVMSPKEGGKHYINAFSELINKNKIQTDEREY